jgi:hypothetical protein
MQTQRLCGGGVSAIIGSDVDVHIAVSNGDDDGDGISNNKDNNTAINKIQVDTGSNDSACFTNHPTLIVTLGYGELLNHWSDVGDIGYYGNSEGLCGGVSCF